MCTADTRMRTVWSCGLHFWGEAALPCSSTGGAPSSPAPQGNHWPPCLVLTGSSVNYYQLACVYKKCAQEQCSQNLKTKGYFSLRCFTALQFEWFGWSTPPCPHPTWAVGTPGLRACFSGRHALGRCVGRIREAHASYRIHADSNEFTPSSQERTLKNKHDTKQDQLVWNWPQCRLCT